MVKISDIRSPKSVKKRKRLGRGNASGHGTTSGRGTKGQLSRSGGKTRVGFEGGQMPLQRRLPYLRGFKNTRRKIKNIVNIWQLEKFKDNSIVDYKFLEKNGLIMKKAGAVKILGNGKLTKKITVKADYFSKNAETKIKKAGGKVEVV
jgi:large subunit ribosomal protein L15